MKLTDIIGCAGSVVLLLSAATWIPVLGLFFALLTPLPFLYYAARLGLRNGMKIAAVTFLIVGLLAKVTGYLQMMVSCFESGLLGLILSELYRRKYTLGLTIFLGTCSVLLVWVLFLSLITSSGKTGATQMNPESNESRNEEIIQAYKDFGISEDKVIQLQKVMDIITKIYPAMFILGTAFSVSLIVLLSRLLFRFKELPYPDFGPMDQWQTPELMVWGVIVTGFALFLTTGGIKLIAGNALIVMAAIYVFHGLSITQFFLNKYHAPFWGRLGVYLLIIIMLPYFLVTLAIAGLFDQWADFRKLNQKPVK